MNKLALVSKAQPVTQAIKNRTRRRQKWVESFTVEMKEGIWALGNLEIMSKEIEDRPEERA